MATYNKFQCFTEDCAESKHNFASHTFKILLTNVAPVATNTIRSELVEITAGNGYAAGGLSMTLLTSAQTSGVYRPIFQDQTLTATGTIGPFRYIVVYNSTSATNPLVCWFDYNTSLTLSTGEALLFDFDGVNGLFSLT
jgi:hypothetical protein